MLNDERFYLHESTSHLYCSHFDRFQSLYNVQLAMAAVLHRLYHDFATLSRMTDTFRPRGLLVGHDLSSLLDVVARFAPVELAAKQLQSLSFDSSRAFKSFGLKDLSIP